MANPERSLIKTIRTRQMRCMGHAYRKDGFKQLMMGMIENKQRTTARNIPYVGSLNTWATSKI
jgi:hypothetical protein